MSTDSELEAWRSQWQSSNDDSATARSVADLRSRTLKQSRAQWIGLIAPVLVTVIIGGGMLIRAVDSGSTLDVALAIECWLFIVVAWAGSLWIARGTWKPLGETTADFIAVSIRRCQANIRGVAFGTVLYIGQLIAVVAVIYGVGTPEEARVTGLGTYVFSAIAVGLLLLVFWGLWFTARQRRRLASLRELEQELSEADAL